MNKKVLLLLPALALLLGLGGCTPKVTPSSSGEESSSQSGDVAVTEVEVTPESATIQVGETKLLAANVKPFNATNKDVVWSSDHENIATVNASGLVTGVDEGVAHIRATSQADSTKYDECVVTVEKAYVVDYLKEVDASKSFKLGVIQENLQDKKIYFDGGAQDGRAYSFTTSNEWGKALDARLVQVTGGYNISYVEGETTKYINIEKDVPSSTDSSKYHLQKGTTAYTVWTWNDELDTLETIYEGTGANAKKCYIGTNGNYETLSGIPDSKYSFSFPAHLFARYEVCDPTSVELSIDAGATLRADNFVEVKAALGPIGAAGDLSWTVTGDTHVTVDKNGKVSADAEATVGGTVTVKAAFSEEVFGTLDLTIGAALNYGTQASPLSVDAAIALLDSESPTHKEVYVSGIVSENDEYGTQFKNWGDYIKMANDANTKMDALVAYRAKPAENTGYETTYAAKDSMASKRATFKGVCEMRGTQPQVALGGLLINVAAGDVEPTAIAIDPAGDFTLEQGASKTLSAKLTPANASATVAWSVLSVSGSDVTLCHVEAGVVSLDNEAVAGTQYQIKAVAKAGIEDVVTVTVAAKGSQPVETTAVFDFTDTAQKTSHTTTLQTWVSGAVTFKLEKNTSSTNVAEYTPLRAYKNHKITISIASGKIKSLTFITEGEVQYSTSSSNYDFAGTETVTGGTMNAGTKQAVVTANSNVTEISIVNTVRQVRISQLTVVYEA